MGLAKGAFESATAYVHQREAFGQKIADFQAMQHMRAELATEIEAGSLMVYNAARMKDHGHDFVKEAAMAKYYCSEVCMLSIGRICCSNLRVFPLVCRWLTMLPPGVSRCWEGWGLLKISQWKNSTGTPRLVCTVIIIGGVLYSV